MGDGELVMNLADRVQIDTVGIEKLRADAGEAC